MQRAKNTPIKKISLLTLVIFTLIVSNAFAVDTTAPVTTLTKSGTEGNPDNTWYVSAVDLTLTCSDLGEGCKTLTYAIDGAGTQNPTWPTPFFRAVPISNPTGATGTQRVLVTVDTQTPIADGKLNSDCSNMRFTTQSNADLSYWIEPAQCNKLDSRVWVKVSMSGVDNTIRWYFGQANQPDASSWADAINPYVDSLATASSDYGFRKGHQTLSFNNKLWVLGGWDGLGAYGDAWSSTDGSSWTEETSNGFPARVYADAVVYDNKMWVIGGNDGIATNSGNRQDVYSSSSGTSWTAGPSMPSPARSEHDAVVYSGKIWVLGGRTNGGTSARLKDIDTFDGSSWSSQVDPTWTARYGHAAVVFKNKIWVLGGYDGAYKNDVYSYDGTWQSHGNADWSARYRHEAIVFDDKLWVFGGADGSTQYEDVWYATYNDATGGLSWTQYTSNPTWVKRDSHSAAVHNNLVYLTGGYSVNTELSDAYRLFRNYPLLTATASNTETPQNGIDVSVSKNGNINFTYSSSDAANPANVETVKHEIFKIDTQKPLSTGATVPLTNGWVPNPDFTITCSDANPNANAVSGCLKSVYCIYNDGASPCVPDIEQANSNTYTIPNSQFGCNIGELCYKKVRFYSIDNAGNTEDVKTSGLIKIDKKSPATTHNAPSAWQKAISVPVTLTCAENPEGVGCNKIKNCYTESTNTCTPANDGGSGNPFNLIVNVECPQGSECTRSLKFQSYDLFNNLESVKNTLVKLDTKAPSTQGVIESMTADVDSLSVISNDPTDSGVGVSGIDAYQFYSGTSQSNVVNGPQGWQSSNSILLDGFGPNSLHCFSVQFRDALDNQQIAPGTGTASCAYTLANNPTLNVISKATGTVTISLNENTNPLLTTKYEMYLKEDGSTTKLWVNANGYTGSFDQRRQATKAEWNAFILKGKVVGASTEELKPNHEYQVGIRSINSDGVVNEDITEIDLVTLGKPPSSIDLEPTMG